MNTWLVCPMLAHDYCVRFELLSIFFFFFFFNDTATTEIYTLSLHDALPISTCICLERALAHRWYHRCARARSEEHTSELQSLRHLVCRLLLEKKNKKQTCKQPNHQPIVTQRNYTPIIKSNTDDYNLCIA